MHDRKRRTDAHIHDSRRDGGGYSSSKRERSLQSRDSHDDTSHERKYMRTQSASSNRVVSSSSASQQQQQQRYNGEKKTSKDTKKPLRVSGDWSEFKSSTGKTFFYNCKTEVSQWEKPKGWPSDDSHRSHTSSTSRNKKESSSDTPSTVRARHKVEDASSHSLNSHSNSKSTAEKSIKPPHQNGHHPHPQPQTNEQPVPAVNSRLASPGDDSSRMSFSSTSSKESSSAVTSKTPSNGSVLHSSLSEPAIQVTTPVPDNPPLNFIPINGKTNDPRHPAPRTTADSAPVNGVESTPSATPKAEREQEIQKFYRAELIQHLTDWPSTQLEKQCLKLFDDYYAYSVKTATAFTELKALKSNFRVLEIKRNTILQRLHRCRTYAKEREENRHA